ncbi:hypothetical protein PbDSM24746_51430 [Paenibacillus macerans]|nr:hypothetical protein PbDSM24746_51430 [Paenibacillus macerans]GBK71483.1 hypothetical protein PbJCM17693_51910 [Paenibacillus macerans]GIP08658.1 hypothetical protein J1TS5_08280 [Paenibacillus macerans]
MIGAIVALMFALELGGQLYAWDSVVILGLFAAFALLFIVFLLAERRAGEPIISFGMFRKRLFASSNADDRDHPYSAFCSATFSPAA